MSIKDLPHVTVEQVLALRKAAIELEQELATLKASLPKIKADAVLSLLDTDHTCETPNGDSAWSSNDIEECADQLEAGE